MACVGRWICWASCSSHCTFNYSCTQITSRIPASMSRLPPPHANTLLRLLMPLSHFQCLPLLPLLWCLHSVNAGLLLVWEKPVFGFHNDKFGGKKEGAERTKPEQTASIKRPRFLFFSFHPLLLTRADKSSSVRLYGTQTRDVHAHTWMLIFTPMNACAHTHMHTRTCEAYT